MTRYTLGQFAHLTLACTNGDGQPAAPTRAPTVKLYDSDGALTLSALMPPLDRYGATGLFDYRLRLGDDYEAGQFMVCFGYQISGTPFIKTARFEIVGGGDSDGAIVSMVEYRRPGATYLVQRLDSDQRVLGRVAS